MRDPSPRAVIAAVAIGVGALGVMWQDPTQPLVRSLSAAAPQNEQRPVFRGGTTLVSLDVYPRTNGQIIEGLTKGDFVVTEDGKPQTIDTFQFIKYLTTTADADRRDPLSVSSSEREAADPKNRLFVVYLDPYNIQFENL